MQDEPRSHSLKIRTKLLIGFFVLLVVMQFAGLFIALTFSDIHEKSIEEGYFPHPWLSMWSLLSCCSIPFVFMLIIAVVCFLTDKTQSKHDLFWLIFVLVGCVLIICYILLLSFYTQLTFVPPPGSS
jgi:RsiW-degrading membrane proteinase PrsW (M82 family)